MTRPMIISSRDNRRLTRFRALLRQGKPEPGLVAVEGFHLVAEALRSALALEAVLVSTSGEDYLSRLPNLPPDARLLRTTDRLFASVADTATPQGIAALVRLPVISFDEIVRSRAPAAPLVVVLFGVQDPGNVGTITRAAEAFGASGLITCPAGTIGTANPFSPKALRASAGSALRLPILHGMSASVTLAQLRVSLLPLVAASATQGTAPAGSDLSGPVALLVGNEAAGLPPEVERSADRRIRILIAAPVDSLNAALAAAVILYEAARQRGHSS